jgi:hypothetical protein
MLSRLRLGGDPGATAEASRLIQFSYPLVICWMYCCGRHAMEEVVDSIPTRSPNICCQPFPDGICICCALRIVPCE